MGTLAIIRSLVISILCVQFAFEPLAMANQQNKFRQDLVKHLAEMQKSKKDLTFGEYYKSIEKKLPTQTRSQMGLLAKAYGKEVVPKFTVLNNNTSSDRVTVLIEKGRQSMKVDLASNGSIRMNGQTFEQRDYSDLSTYSKKLAKAFPESLPLANKVRRLKGERLTLTYDEVKALSQDRQAEYFVYLRDMMMAADTVLSARKRAPASEEVKENKKNNKKEGAQADKAKEVSSFIMKLIVGEDAVANSAIGKPCVIAGNPSTFALNKSGNVSCGGAQDSPDVAQPPQVVCDNSRNTQVKCNPAIFADPNTGGILCISSSTSTGFHRATYDCDKLNPVKKPDGSNDKEAQRKTAKAILKNSFGADGKLTKENIDIFNEKYEAAIKASEQICLTAKTLGADSKQDEACQVLNNRRFTLDDSDIEGAGDVKEPPDHEVAPQPGKEKDEGFNWLWLLLGIPVLGLLICLLMGCFDSKQSTPGYYPPPQPNNPQPPAPPPPPAPTGGPDSGAAPGGTATGG